MRILCLLIVLFMPAAAVARSRRGVLNRHPPSEPSVLHANEGSLERENVKADDHNLVRIENRKELTEQIAKGELVQITQGPAYGFEAGLGEHDPDAAELYAYAKPWVKRFLDEVLGEGFATLHRRFSVTSLVRTMAYQEDLKRHNRFAARGDTKMTRSSHTTGSTVDIGLEQLTWDELQWLRKKLIDLEMRGLVLATEETGNKCMHIMVLPKYAEQFPETKPEQR